MPQTTSYTKYNKQMFANKKFTIILPADDVKMQVSVFAGGCSDLPQENSVDVVIEVRDQTIIETIVIIVHAALLNMYWM